MKPSTSLLGASRLPLTPKRGNKDFYKGTRQSYVPGGGHRTGPPGRHVVQGKAKYRLLDTRVRYFVGPGAEALAKDDLRPYVSTLNPAPPRTSLPSFSPNHSSGKSTPAFTKFSREYQRLTAPEKEALKLEARRNWWDGMVAQFGDRSAQTADEEAATRAVEQRAETESAART